MQPAVRQHRSEQAVYGGDASRHTVLLIPQQRPIKSRLCVSAVKICVCDSEAFTAHRSFQSYRTFQLFGQTMMMMMIPGGGGGRGVPHSSPHGPASTTQQRLPLSTSETKQCLKQSVHCTACALCTQNCTEAIVLSLCSYGR